MSSAGNKVIWQMVRLRRETVNQLRSLERRLEVAREKGMLIHGDEPGEQGWSVDALVTVLLNRDGRHREACRKAARKSYQKRIAARRPETAVGERNVSSGGLVDDGCLNDLA